MRVYSRGKEVPMDEVDWRLLCRADTVVTNEDPEVHWPKRIEREREKAIRELTKFLKLTLRPLKETDSWA